MTQIEKILQEVFGNITFEQQPSIEAIRRFHSNSTYCLDEEGKEIIGLACRASDSTDLSLTAKFKHLQYLNISGNSNLKAIKFEEAMPDLFHLDLNENILENLTLPAGFAALKHLDVSRNKLQELLLSSSFPELILLDISDNELVHLQLDTPKLQYAYLLKNKIKELEFSVAPKKMEILHLSTNKLERLPTNFLEFVGLKLLYLDGNPLSSIPKENVSDKEGENSLANVRNYLLSLSQDESISNDEVKLVLLGNSTAGKSSLVKYLMDSEYDERLASTHGIQNHLWQPDGANYKVNIWDFGGQEFYHATHRLFLSNNAVSLILFEEATNSQGFLPTHIKLYEDNELVTKQLELEHFPYTYWLDNLYYFSQRPVPESTLLIQNKMDLPKVNRVRITDEDFANYSLPPEHIQHISIKSAATAERRFVGDFENFREDLFKILEATKAQYGISIKWIEIKEGLRGLAKTKPLLSYEDYVSFCEKIKPEISQEGIEGSMLNTLTHYLHEISVILYYSEIESLKDTVFINPQWVTDIIYRVLDYKVIRKEGYFDKVHVDQVLNNPRLKGSIDASQLIDLMKKFELIFEVKQQANKYVAPQYLPDQPGPYDKKQLRRYEQDCTNLAFVLNYPNFSPKSIMSRIICKYGNLSIDTFWRAGIGFDLKDNQGRNTRFLILKADRQIVVKTEEVVSPALIHQIFEELRIINQRNPKIQLSCDGKDFVWLEEFLNHSAQNSQIRSVDGQWLEIQDFKLLHLQKELEGKTLHKEDLGKGISPTSLDLNRQQMKILFLASNPHGTGRLRLDKESREVEEALRRSKNNNFFKFSTKFAVRPKDLSRALLDEKPNILHFSGHGIADKKPENNEHYRGIGISLRDEKKEIEGIFLEDEQGRRKLISSDALADLVELFPDLDCVILNSCYSAVQAKVIHEHVPYVIGMSKAINDDTAIQFATSFYDAIAADNAIEFAFKFAKTNIRLEGLEGDAIPQLLKNEQIIKRRNAD